MRPMPLTWRVSLLVTALLVAVIGTISAVAYVELGESLISHIDQTLLAMSRAILGVLDEHDNDYEEGMEVRSITGASADRHSPRHRVWLDGASENIAYSDPATSGGGPYLRDMPEGQAPETGGYRFLDVGRRKREYRAVWLRHQGPGGVVNVAVAYSTRRAYHEMHEFLRLLLVLGAGIVIAAALVAILIVRWGLRPVGETAKRLGRVTARNTGGADLRDLAAPVELRPFVTAVADMLERLDEAMRRQKRFTGDASHELRTPLALAKSTLQAIRTRDRDAEEYRQAVDETLGDLDRMERLIAQLLTLARLDEARETFPSEEVRLDAVLRDVGESFDAKLSGSGGRVVCQELPATRVRGDASGLRQLFGNLVDNAFKHGPSGGTVRVLLEHRADGHAHVSIHDAGGGIAPEDLPRLFDRFYRVDSSRTRATGGTGLGLAIAREIARHHGGDIAIASSPADGTRVVVRLPRLCTPALSPPFRSTSGLPATIVPS